MKCARMYTCITAHLDACRVITPRVMRFNIYLQLALAACTSSCITLTAHIDTCKESFHKSCIGAGMPENVLLTRRMHHFDSAHSRMRLARDDRYLKLRRANEIKPPSLNRCQLLFFQFKRQKIVGDSHFGENNIQTDDSFGPKQQL